MKQFIEFIYELHTEPISNDFLGWTLLILIWILSLSIICIISLGVIYLIDFSFLPIEVGQGEIIGKYFEPAHTTTTIIYNAAAKTSLPVTQWHDDAWVLIIEINGMQDDFNVSSTDYKRFFISQKIQCEFVNGRICKSLLIKSIQF